MRRIKENVGIYTHARGVSRSKKLSDPFLSKCITFKCGDEIELEVPVRSLSNSENRSYSLLDLMWNCGFGICSLDMLGKYKNEGGAYIVRSLYNRNISHLQENAKSVLTKLYSSNEITGVIPVDRFVSDDSLGMLVDEVLKNTSLKKNNLVLVYNGERKFFRFVEVEFK